MKKIALIGTTANSLLNFRKDLILKLVRDGFEVHGFAIDFDETSIKQLQSLGATPQPYKFNRTGLNPIADLLNTWRLTCQLRNLGPHIALSYFAKPVIFGTLAAWLARVPRRIGMLEGLGYVFTDQASGNPLRLRLLRLVMIMLYQLSFRLVDLMIFLNPDDPIDLKQRFKLQLPKFEILGGIGVNLNEFKFCLPTLKPVRFLFIGRLLAEKGIFDFIEATKIIKRKYETAEFVVLGDIDEKNPGSLKAKDLERLKKDHLIIAPGHISDVKPWIVKSSVFVLPSSYREGVPRSTQEAMAMGRAVITTDVPGCRETVIDGENGWLVPKWQPKRLAEQMELFINNPEAILEMGKKSFEIAKEKYDADIVNDRLVNMLWHQTEDHDYF
jgi:glycosyltransferase involved in cell wall biosynthesis